jgi:hypothetical protein
VATALSSWACLLEAALFVMLKSSGITIYQARPYKREQLEDAVQGLYDLSISLRTPLTAS